MKAYYLIFEGMPDAMATLVDLNMAEKKEEGVQVNALQMTPSGPVYVDVLFGTGQVPDSPGYHVNLLAPDAWELPPALAAVASNPNNSPCVFQGAEGT